MICWWCREKIDIDHSLVIVVVLVLESKALIVIQKRYKRLLAVYREYFVVRSWVGEVKLTWSSPFYYLFTDSAGLSQESQHSYSSITEHPPYYSLSSQRIQTTPNSHPLPRHPPPTRSVPLEKTEPSQFSKCDDISVQSGVARLSSSPQIVGPQTLQGYLDSLPETPEYKQAMQSRNPKKGWKPLDGKHITTGKKVAFKPIFWDNEGRMRHGVRVRGSDKSEECWRHVEGKAPAGCTFAHSRLGDTLQFICVKCTYEKGRNEWCSDKMKHKQYIFNLGAYRNLEGGIWKKTS